MNKLYTMSEKWQGLIKAQEYDEETLQYKECNSKITNVEVGNKMVENLIAEIENVLRTWTAPTQYEHDRLKRIVYESKNILEEMKNMIRVEKKIFACLNDE